MPAPPKPPATKPNVGAGPLPPKAMPKAMDMLAKTPPVWNRLSTDARRVLENLCRQMIKQGQPKAMPAAPRALLEES